jgi:hypothetical protein
MGRTRQPIAVGVRAGRGSARRGVALLLVLIILAAGTLVTMRYLQAASERLVLTQMLVDSKKAGYVADSGISEACYWLRHPELTSGVAWTGVAGRRPDTASADFYNVTIGPKTGKPNWYVVSSEGHRVDGAGNGTVRTVTADFQMYYGFAEAVTTLNDLKIPAGVRITGNVYASNNLDNSGTIDGSVWVGNHLANTGTITGMTNLNCALRSIGSYPVDTIIVYLHKGNNYIVDTILVNSTTNQTWGSSSGNPMGVWYRNGDLVLNGTTTVEGTLHVRGNLWLAAGSTTVITPKANWPAMLVSGELKLLGDGAVATINGAVIACNTMKTETNSAPNARLTINGPVVFPGGGGGFDSSFATNAKVVINQDPARADVSGYYTAQPRTPAGARMMGYRADGR